MSATAIDSKSSQLFSDEILAHWLNSLKYEWSALTPKKSIETAWLKDNGYPEASRKSTKTISIILQGLWELNKFDLDGYQYEVDSDRIIRRGPKVKAAPPKPLWQVHRIGGPPTS